MKAMVEEIYNERGQRRGEGTGHVKDKAVESSVRGEGGCPSDHSSPSYQQMVEMSILLKITLSNPLVLVECIFEIRCKV